MKSLFAFFILCPLLATAQENTSTTQVPADIVIEKPLNYGLSFESSSFNYQEPSIMEVNGRLSGVNVNLEYRFNSRLGAYAQYKYLAGEATYKGSLSNGTPHTSLDRFTMNNFVLQSRLHLTPAEEPVDIVLLLGLGRRVTIDANDRSLYDYFRSHTYNFYTLGALGRVRINSDSLVELQISFDSLISGRSVSRISDVNSNYPDLDLAFTKGKAFNAKITYELKTEFGYAFAGAEYSQWELEKSELSGIYDVDGDSVRFLEPKNKTTTLGFQAGLIF